MVTKISVLTLATTGVSHTRNLSTKTKALRPFEPSTRCNIAEDLNYLQVNTARDPSVSCSPHEIVLS